MNKKIITLVFLIGLFSFSNKTQAIIIPPIFTININEHSTGGDDTFNFHLRANNPPDPVTYEIEDFSIDTVDGSGQYSTGGISGSSTIFHLKQDETLGWHSPTIVCSSDNPLVTTTLTTDGIDINGQGFSSIDCDITNIKISSSKTPVLIIPGVMGTDIFNNTNKLWLDVINNISDIGDQFMDPLQFNNNLTPINVGLSFGNVIGKIPSFLGFGGFDYTGSLIEEFQNQGYTQGLTSNDNLFLFPYDWRYGVSDNTVALLKSKIDEIRTQTGSDKVDVVAHSTGGLLAKKYAIDNQNDNHIGKAVFVGVPNTGAPKAIKVLLQGDNFSNPFLSDSEMKKIARNLPVVYDLSPSEQYYNQKGSYIKVIDQPFLISHSRDLNFNESNLFLTNDHPLNSQALTNAHNLHTTNFDNFDLRTVGIDLYSINGCKAGTLGRIVERRQKDIFGNDLTTYDQPEEVPGDGTVPLESATNLPIDSTHKYYALKADHGKMPSQDGIRQQVVNIISGSSLSIDGNKITQDISQCKLNGKAVSIFSPLSIDVTDQNGNHSGMGADGNIYNDIPNADFQVMGDHKFVYLPNDEGQLYTVKIVGTGDGTFTLKNENIINNQVSNTEIFSDIPVTTELVGAVNFGDFTTLALDKNGDGSVDEMVSPDTNIEPSLTDLLILLEEKIPTLNIKDKIKQNLLKQILNLEKKIDNKVQKNLKILTNIGKKISKQEIKGSINDADAGEILNLIDILENKIELVLDAATITELKNKIQSLGLKNSLKNDLLKRIENLEKRRVVLNSLSNLSNNIIKKTDIGKIPDTDAQALLDILSQIEATI